MKVSGPIPLAIVIPAFKTRYLRETLESIASQTNQNFRLYVGDDCSPEPVEQVVRQFEDKLDIEFHRFETNLGSVSLKGHWERCFRLSREPWVWCFADDDCMEADCVATFLEELKISGGSHDLYRFNTRWINGANEVIAESPSHPLDESGGDFLKARLRGERNSTLQEVIFSRQAWECSDGIPDFPLGWTADDAFIAQLGRRRPIRSMASPRVRWRLSDVNISNNASSATLAKKIKASAEFVRWTIKYFTDKPEAEKAEIIRLTEQWFQSYVAHTSNFLGWRNSLEIEQLTHESWGRPKGAGWWWAFRNNWQVTGQKIGRRIRGRQ